MQAEEVLEVIEVIDPYLAAHTEVQLADYGETANGGPYIKFRLADASELDLFRGQDRAAKNKAGKRYILMLIEIGDDEAPIKNPSSAHQTTPPKGGPLSKRAAALCRDPDFQLFVDSSTSRDWKERLPKGMLQSPEQVCRQYILDACQIKSRAELDHSERAATLFQRSILGPFIREVA